MLKWLAISLGSLTVAWIVLHKENLSWPGLICGIALASALYVMLALATKDKSIESPPEEKLQGQERLEEAEAKTSQLIEGLNREVQKFQQKSIRADERCLAYQKLVEVHQQEIEKLRYENQAVAQQLIQKERKLNELYLSKMEPDLFDTQRREAETLNRELKKQLQQTKGELAELITKKRKKVTTEASESRDLLS